MMKRIRILTFRTKRAMSMKKRLLQILIALRDGKSVPASQMSEWLMNGLLSYGAVAREETYKVTSEKDFNNFVYDLGFLPELLEHDLEEAD